MQGNGGQGTRAGRRLVVVVACLCGLVLSVVGASGVLALTGMVSSPTPTVAAAPTAPVAVPTTPGTATPTVTVTATPTLPARSAPPVAIPAPRPTAQAPTAARRAATLYPVVGITDGDTIKVRVGGTTERVRLIGLDAPELKGAECWSQKASSRMQSLVQSRSVQLVRDPTQDDRDRYGRLLRHVVTADGQLVAQALIEGGFAKEYTYDGAYAHRDAYRAAQERARGKGLGVWSAACAAPPRAAPAPTGAPAAPVKPSGSCVIKGNISSSGEKIYHVPGGGSYDVTVITESKGERWFCSEQAAEAAGWRRARN